MKNNGNALLWRGIEIKRKTANKAMQSDAATCHALCVPHKGAPACYAVDGGVSASSEA
ncbi:hypothetical protein [Psychromonas sp.]|uniref:hypothetical protein n=1 Tax=Psychromonas sp. TaxID=1884585 RepID=UPI0039E434E4